MGLSLWEKYQMLFGKASSPKAADCTRTTIYSFEKYCKACNSGMNRPLRHEPRIKRKLYKIGFCSENCQSKGPMGTPIFSRPTKPTIRSQFKNSTLDDMISISKALDEAEAKLPPFVRLLKEIDIKYNLLSEKLSAMELITGEKWYASKFYYWLERTF